MTELLEVQHLVKHYKSGSWFSGGTRTVFAVNGVSFRIAAGETLALVGESGCGKSTVGRTVLRLLEPTAGQVVFEGRDLAGVDQRSLRQLRRRMQIVFQDPYSSLNPRLTVGASVGEGLEIHRLVSSAERPARVAGLLEEVGLDPGMSERYPHEFSGGQRQRIGIARALAVEPVFLVCDEAVSALDVSVQAQILNLFLDLRERRGLAYLFIAHDLAVVRQIAHRVAVMYLGVILEEGETQTVISRPRHPYTKALISAVPVPDPARQRMRIVLPGDPPSPLVRPPGCPFYSRCFHPSKNERCIAETPPLREVDGRQVACHYAEEY
jgi:oligopeptide/dipeptide ABC transporter ATP-binding protein